MKRAKGSSRTAELPKPADDRMPQRDGASSQKVWTATNVRESQTPHGRGFSISKPSASPTTLTNGRMVCQPWVLSAMAKVLVGGKSPNGRSQFPHCGAMGDLREVGRAIGQGARGLCFVSEQRIMFLSPPKEKRGGKPRHGARSLGAHLRIPFA